MFKKGYTPWNKGKSLSEDCKRKMSIVHKGQTHSLETRIKMSKIAKEKGFGKWMKGMTPWNKDKELSEEHKIKMSNSHKGKKHSLETRKKMSHIAWNRGSKLSEETKIKMSKSLMGHTGYMKGKHHSEEAKQKISKANKGRSFNVMYGKDNPAWKDGRTKQKGYRTLKVKARKYRLKAGGELNSRTIQLVYEDNIKKYGTLTCYLCLKPIEFGIDSLEHKIPLFRGGNNEYSNLAIAHRLCNSKKGIKTLEEYTLLNNMPQPNLPIGR